MDNKTAKKNDKKKLKFIDRVKQLQGDPHYLAMGMATGVFTAMTPLIPFHTVMAIAIAYILKGSRPAAILGVWASNPFTVILIYIGCYKIAILFLGHSHGDATTVKILVHTMEQDIDLYDKFIVFVHFFNTKLKLFAAMVAGGVIMGLPAGVVSYFLTKTFVRKIDLQRDKRSDKKELL